jgi:serine phosphatase RsbU (regulator of sigma subunit)
VIDNDNNELMFSNSGQFPYPVIKTVDDIIVLESKGMPVGLMPNPTYTNHFMSISREFLFIAFSDGILEILPQDSLQRKEAFLKDLIASEGFNINSLITKCGLINLKSLPDDITFLIIRKGGQNYDK